MAAPGEIRDALARVVLRLGKKHSEMTTDQIRDVLHREVGDVKPSSFRSALQVCKYIERVRRGVYRLKNDL